MTDAVQPGLLNMFISYSVHDTAVVDVITAHLAPHARVQYWNQDKDPGKDAWTTIHSWIDSADLVVVVLTGKALARAMSVGNEVGYALKAGKRIIPLVAPEVPSGELGCLSSLTYVRLDYGDVQSTVDQVKRSVVKFAAEKAESARALALLGIIALGLIAFSN